MRHPPLLKLHEDSPESHIVGIGPGLFTQKLREDPLCEWLEDSGDLFGVSFTSSEAIPPNFFYGANTSMKRELFHEVGPFDEDFPYHTTDDWELGLRLTVIGIETVYLPDAIARHHHPVGLEERRKSMFRAGVSGSIYDAKHASCGTLHPACRYSARGHRWRSWTAKLYWRLSGSAWARETFWRHTLADAYMTGYETYAREILTDPLRSIGRKPLPDTA